MHDIDNDITEFHKCLLAFRDKAFYAPIGVNSYWAQGLKPPTFMIMGLAYMTSPPTFVT